MLPIPHSGNMQTQAASHMCHKEMTASLVVLRVHAHTHSMWQCDIEDKCARDFVGKRTIAQEAGDAVRQLVRPITRRAMPITRRAILAPLRIKEARQSTGIGRLRKRPPYSARSASH